MTEINQDSVRGMQDQLRGMFWAAVKVRDHCCATHQCDQRDKASRMISHISALEAEAGSLNFVDPEGNQVGTRSGGKG